MIYRSTFGSFKAMQQLLAKATDRLTDASLDASSLERLRRPSAHPADAAEVMQLRAELDHYEALEGRLSSAVPELSVADSVLDQAENVMVRALELATTMASEYWNAGDRALAATEVMALQESLLASANATFAGVHIFAGTAVDTDPFLADGTYVGSAMERAIPLFGADTLVIGRTGDQIFNQPGEDPFVALDNLLTALQTNDVAAVSASIDEVDSARGQLVSARVEYGSALSHVEDLATASQDANTAIQTVLGTLEELDAAEAFSSLAQAQTSYEASAATLVQTLQTSIFKYM